MPNRASHAVMRPWSLRQLVPRVARDPALARRVEVREDIGAPKAVDGLLRITDQDQGRLPGPEGPAQDLPLDRVGVLKLVDERHLIALP